MTPLPPGARIGMLGGGQLGRLLALEAARLGFDVHVFCPEARSPAARVAAFETVADYGDVDALGMFARSCDVVTYEFENVPVATVDAVIAAGCPVRPGAASLDVSQDRLAEKAFLNGIGIPTVDYRPVPDAAVLAPALAALGGRGILKTCRHGYDGKGQVRIEPDGTGLAEGLRLAASAPCILEAVAPFVREVSVIVARGEGGTVAYDPAENVHETGILVRSTVPAAISAETTDLVAASGLRLADALGHVGVLALEMFVLGDGRLLANEMAPRVHNSGHWTPEACETGQFEQHVRAVAGWPLGPVTRHFDARMTNVLGEDIRRLPAGLGKADKATAYGKRAPIGGRKMGHIVERVPLGALAQAAKG